ncbi:DEAD/DEAH box helicase [Myxacorys almedinensis]|uniref:DEAD/DEAH box helicase n=1 Tax=Myxacorys almedinensis A TaxID=2690445 RepID=A0A8J8CIT6_9CYAN|nr:DEAD/DEAH box helicase [Myxacorys almedinensis A]
MNTVPSARLDLQAIFPFELDEFQLQAIAALEAEKSVVVCAPTGSGKTLIGEYAIHRALAGEKRVFYTTPLKALSNQKLRDFREEFGAENVGLLTGDTSVNREAPIVVMTTEIFRNMLYGTPIGEVGTSLTGVEAVVLDECHYMNDRQRGTVWEESIIYCPPDVQLVALSATVANSDQLTDWIGQVHGATELIYSDFRPVPLHFSFCNPKGLFPLLDDSGKRINPRLKPKRSQYRPKGANQRGAPRPEAPTIAFTLSQLRAKDMLPAIYFIFSRRGCDKAVEDLGDLSLVNAAEAARLKSRIDAFLDRNPEAGRARQIEPLYRGIAAHHAGILPAWKGLVEELFQEGLIKVVFATETLAAGINMPARTTVISSLSKRTDAGHRLLNPSEFLQMAGRAGRRGMDDQGYVVTLQTPFEGAKEAAYLATSQADPLVSQFTPSYGMVLNLLQTHTIEQAKELIERSFGQYLSTLYLRPQQEELDRCKSELAQQKAAIAAVDWKLLNQYEKLQERLKEEKRLLKTLQSQADDMQASERAIALSFAVAGTLLTLKGDAVRLPDRLPAVLVTKVQGAGQFPYLVCLGKNNRWYVMSVGDVAQIHGDVPRLAQVDAIAPPPSLILKPGQTNRGDEESAAIVAQIADVPGLLNSAPEVYAQEQRTKAVLAQMEAHPVNSWGDRAQILKRQRRIQGLQAEVQDRQTKLGRQSQRHWEEFLALLDILQSFGCLDDLRPTALGQATAAIRGDNELWLGLSLMSGELDHLDPHHLATACAALVTEVSRPDSWTHYDTSETVLQALGELRGIRRQLFQVQRRHQVALPVWLEDELIGLIEQWALGVDWLELCSNTSLDEGDVVRILRRTLDFLSQIPHVPHISEILRSNANRAIQLLDRFPVNEVVE